VLAITTGCIECRQWLKYNGSGKLAETLRPCSG